MRPYVEQILAVTDPICHEHLDAECAELCARLAGKLARKRPSPLIRGDLRIWAGGILYAVGQINFLADPSQTPHATADELSGWLEVRKTTMATKAGTIRKLLKLSHFDPEFSRQEVIDKSPFTWLVEFDGLVTDARHLPLSIQQEAVRLSLIPYVPGQQP